MYVTNHSSHNDVNLVDVYLEGTVRGTEDGPTVSHMVKEKLDKDHFLDTSDVIIFKTGTFDKFRY